jgi:hypothetical protein
LLDVTPTNQGGADADLAVFVDRLAAAGTDRPTTEARARIRQMIAVGTVPPGVRRLAEALAASTGELPPPPRRPSEDPGAVVAAIRDTALVVLQDFDAAATAGAIGALLADGRRVVVVAEQSGELAAVRDVLPAHVAARALDALPALSPAELRELRRLLAASTPERRARAGQALPPSNVLPAADEVARLCALATRTDQPAAGADAAVSLLPALLADLDEIRRAAVTSVARSVHRGLAELRSRHEHEWAWELLSELIYTRQRAVVDRMLQDAAQVLAALDRTRDMPAVTFEAAPPPDAMGILRRYHDFLLAGGRSRTYFRSAAQREVQPVLELAQIGSRRPESVGDVQALIEYLELVELQARIDAGCVELGVPIPRDEHELIEIDDTLKKVVVAARSVSALRHDVLFIAPDSPVSVPDVESAAEIAEVILDSVDHGLAVQASRRLDALADALAALTPVAVMAPEQERASVALRERDAVGYAQALDALDAARRGARDESVCSALLELLIAAAPRLAQAWTELAESDPRALGFVVLQPATAVLSELPPADSADVVVVLGAARLGMERLLLAAVAPRMIAVVGPGEQPAEAPTLLSVLQRASALVIRGQGAGGRVVPLATGAQRARAAFGRAGA